MRNFKLTLAYDGTDFHGWQIQPGRATIQGSLVAVLEGVVGQRVIVHGAGRTDAGVHALGQAANFHAETRLDAPEFQRALNALLPPAIRILEAEEVDLRFHARWDALAKTYQYRIFRGRVLSPFDRRYTLHYPLSLNEEAMAEAARLFVGEHDFGSFAASAGSEAGEREINPRREILRSEILRRAPPAFAAPGTTLANLAARLASAGSEGELVYVVRGKSFLRHMVRKLVGTLLDVGRGRLTLEAFRELFELRDRSRSGAAVPPEGLALASVEYAEPWRIV